MPIRSSPRQRREGLRKCKLVTPEIDLKPLTPAERLACLLILRESADPRAERLLPAFLGDPDPDIRFAAVQWVGEEKLSISAGTDRRAAGWAGHAAAVRRLSRRARKARRRHARGERRMGRREVSGQGPARSAKRAADSFLVAAALRPDHPATSRSISWQNFWRRTTRHCGSKPCAPCATARSPAVRSC